MRIVASFMYHEYFVVVTDDGGIFRGEIPFGASSSPASIVWQYIASIR